MLDVYVGTEQDVEKNTSSKNGSSTLSHKESKENHGESMLDDIESNNKIDSTKMNFTQMRNM